MSLASFVDLPLDEKEARGLVFTPQEIAHQPETWKTTLDVMRWHEKELCAFLEAAGVRGPVEQRPVVLLIGAGTSDYVGRALELLLTQKWGCEVRAVASTELLPNMEAHLIKGRRYLWISFSRSGDSPESVAVIEQAQKLHPEVFHVVVTCNAEARMASLCHGKEHGFVLLLDDSVNDRSLAMTSSFTNMVVAGQCLANAWSLAAHSRIVEEQIRAGQSFLEQASAVAERLVSCGYPRVCFIGTGSLASVAKESALKVLEMTAGQVKTMSETVLGLRHGPMAALDGKTLFVCFVSGEERRANYARDLLIEIGKKQVVAERVAVGLRSSKKNIAPHCDVYVDVDADIDDMYRPVLDVMLGQLLGLYSSVAHQLKPDAPSPHGVINRVVQKFRIY